METNAKFCTRCGAELPQGQPRFCVACGAPVRPTQQLEPPPATAIQLATPPATAATGATVRLANANVEQAVIGGTIKLASAGAIPPGMWLRDETPGPTDIVALYAPLRAVVGGWSATTSDGWKKVDQRWSGQGGKDLVRFEITREWFPAPGRADNLRLRVTIGASSFAEEGRTRRGFTYRIANDPPMEVLEANWYGSSGLQRSIPVPLIQLMAPPRIRRISDYDEQVRTLGAREADQWARQGAVTGVFRLTETTQQRTPVGRGLPLPELIGGSTIAMLTGTMFEPARVQIRRPLIVRGNEWSRIERTIAAEAGRYGLDLGTDAATEWWLDQQGYDGALFERGAYPQTGIRTAVVFRRSQIARIRE